MLAEFITWLITLIQAYGPWSVFLGVIIEEIIIPIPSPLIQMGAGYLLVPSTLSFIEAIMPMIMNVVIPAAIAATIGSFFAYAIGYFGGKPLVLRMQKYLDVSWNDIEKTGKKFGKGNKTWGMIILLRVIPIVPMSLVSVAAGVLRLSWKKYALATLIGSIPRAFILGFTGWFLGNTFFSAATHLDNIENIVSVIIIVGALSLVYYHRKKCNVKNNKSGKK